MYDKANDRANPLASSQTPLKNVIPTGINEGAAASLRQMNQIALNIPTAAANGQGTFSQNTPANMVSPRIDNEGSFLGMVKFCKDHAAANNDRPFDDPRFNENCGMCVTSGTLIDNTTFDTNSGSKATGVLVYQNDKKQFWKEKDENSYPFTRAIPSLNSATCLGAIKGSDASPALAVTQADYDKFRKRSACIHGSASLQGQSCGACLTNNTKSWIDMAGGFKTVTMVLWGSGNAKVSIGGNVVGQKGLSSTSSAASFPLGLVPEDTPVQIEVNAVAASASAASSAASSASSPLQPVSLYGAIYATTPSGGEYRLAIDDFLEMDAATGSFPRAGLPRTFRVSQGDVSCVELKPQPGKTKLTVTGPFPLTFVDSDQLASYDCPVGPYTMNVSNAALFSTTDPCLNPKGQSVDNYADGCLRATLTGAGCSTEGTWYSDLDVFRQDYKGKSTAEMKTGIDTTSRRDKPFMLKCFNQDLSTPCDPYLSSAASASGGAGAGGAGVPNQACMSYLYTNQSAASDFVGAAYSGTPYIQNPSGTQLPFCQSAGSLNPASAAGLAQLQSAAQSYKGTTGIPAVKSYLTDVFTKSTGTLPQNLPDAKGGRYDSWGACIGTSIQVATAPGTMSVTATPGNRTADISWTTPDTGGVTITGYAVTYTPLESGATVTNTGTNSATITGLRNAVTYTVNVVANNIMGGSTPGSTTVRPVQPVCATAGQMVPFATSQCSASSASSSTGTGATSLMGMWQKYIFGSDSNGGCTQEASGNRVCNSNCPGALTQGGCGYVPCATEGQLVPANNNQCDASGMRQNYIFKSDVNGACVQDASGARWCDATCPGALTQGGCAYVAPLTFKLSTVNIFISTSSYNISGIAWNGFFWIGVGTATSYGGFILKSIDGIIWNNMTTSTSNANPFYGGYARQVAWNGSYWLVVGLSGNTSGCIVKGSADGTSWSLVGGNPYPNLSSASSGAFSLAWNGSYWLVGLYAYSETNSYTEPYKTIYKSTDGTTWNIITSSMKYINALVWNNSGNYWLAGCQNGIYKSSEGLTWNLVYSISSGCRCLAWNGSYWIAFGLLPILIKGSADGLSWISIDIANQNIVSTLAEYNIITGVVWNSRDNYWIAFRRGTLNSVIVGSSDGRSWSYLQGSSFESTFGTGNANILCRAWNGSYWVFGVNMVRNGIFVPIVTTNNIEVCPTSGQTGSDYSLTGMKQNYTWASGPNGTCVKNNNGAAVCDSSYAAATAQGGCAYVASPPSMNITWREVTNPSNPFGTNSAATAVAYGKDGNNAGLWVAVGSAIMQGAGNSQNTDPVAHIITSSDGYTWNNIIKDKFVNTDPGNGPAKLGGTFDVAYGNGLWIVAGFTGGAGAFISKSSNGINWSSATNIIPNQSITRIRYGNIWVAVSTVGIIYSSDGNTWNYPTGVGSIPSETQSVWNDIAYGKDNSGNGLWVAVGKINKLVDRPGSMYKDIVTDITIATSSNGTTWASAGNPFGNQQAISYGNSVSYGKDGNGNGLWIASGYGVNSTVKSSDGYNWTSSPNLPNLQLSYDGNWVNITGTIPLTPNTVNLATRKIASGKDKSGNDLWVLVGSYNPNSIDGSAYQSSSKSILTSRSYTCTRSDAPPADTCTNYRKRPVSWTNPNKASITNAADCAAVTYGTATCDPSCNPPQQSTDPNACAYYCPSSQAGCPGYCPSSTPGCPGYVEPAPVYNCPPAGTFLFGPMCDSNGPNGGHNLVERRSGGNGPNCNQYNAVIGTC